MQLRNPSMLSESIGLIPRSWLPMATPESPDYERSTTVARFVREGTRKTSTLRSWRVRSYVRSPRGLAELRTRPRRPEGIGTPYSYIISRGERPIESIQNVRDNRGFPRSVQPRTTDDSTESTRSITVVGEPPRGVEPAHSYRFGPVMPTSLHSELLIRKVWLLFRQCETGRFVCSEHPPESIPDFTCPY